MKKLISFSLGIFLVILSLAACRTETLVTNTPTSLPPLTVPTPSPKLTNTPAPSPTLTNTPALTSTPTLTNTHILTPTLTSTPTLTNTFILTPTLTSTPTLTPTATVVTFVRLVSPTYGEYQNPFVFRWTGSTSVSHQVTLRHLEGGYTHTSGYISGFEWTFNIPAEQYGNWEWFVTNSRGVRSMSDTFVFNPFPRGGLAPTDTPIAPPVPTR